MDYPKTPNIDKMGHFKKEDFALRQFMEYLESMKISFCHLNETYYPIDKEQCLKDFITETFNVDFDKLEEERREMVKYISEQMRLNIEENSKKNS